jgi:xylose isomerase
VAAVDVSIFGTEYGQGAYTNPDPELRRRAIEVTKRCADVAREMGTHNVGIWPGQDGYDYLFQYDYDEIWTREIEAIREIGEHAPDQRFCFEYKIREPRMFMTVATVGKSLYLCNKVGLDNVGVTVDVGHCFMARENPAESAALLLREGRLFSSHFNDTYGVDDDDMIAGSVHPFHILEYLMVLEDMGYDGWYGLDYFPYREDIVRAAEISIANVKALREVAGRIDRAKLDELRAAPDAIDVQQYLHEVMFGAMRSAA